MKTGANIGFILGLKKTRINLKEDSTTNESLRKRNAAKAKANNGSIQNPQLYLTTKATHRCKNSPLKRNSILLDFWKIAASFNIYIEK
jgi:hypothetical protein